MASKPRLAGICCCIFSLALVAGCDRSDRVLGADGSADAADTVDRDDTSDAASPDDGGDDAATDDGDGDVDGFDVTEDARGQDADDASEAGDTDGATEDVPTTSEIEFRITSPRSDRAVNYKVEVVTEPSKVRDGSRFEAEADNDEISESQNGWIVAGETGTAPDVDKVRGDTFRWDAVDDPQYAIAGWTADAPAEDYTLTINGTEIDPSSLPELETSDPQPQSGCIGGGSCYNSTVSASQADATVGASASLGDLQSKLDAASSGDVVYVDPGADIDLGFDPDSTSLVVPAGVTLASGRGTGSGGARLHGDKKPTSDWQGSDTIHVEDDVRITGLRIEGPTPDRDMNWLGDDHDYTDGIDASSSSNVEIDNNEIYGWPAAAVQSGDPIHVHHNYIHDNDQSGLGYGVSSPQWDSVVEYNRFRWNRHAVAGSGDPGDGYIVRYNTFGAEGIGGAGHKIDMHEDGDTGKAGTKMVIHHNTVKFPNAQAVYLRATPRDSAEIYENWFYNSTQPCLTKNEGGDYCAIQVNAGDWTNVSYRDNHYGDSEPACDIGAPRSGC